MTIGMADSITVADLPPGMASYAGYVNGRWPTYSAVVAAHPGVQVLSITVVLADTAECLDVENGDATVAQAPSYVKMRVAAGIWRPVIYTSEANLSAVVGACAAVGLSRDAYRLWSAHYAGKHICGPTMCGSSVQADGTQWIDHGGWDESLLTDGFFAPAPAPAPTPPAPPPAPLPPNPTEDVMHDVQIQVQIVNGHGVCPLPAGVNPGGFEDPIAEAADPATAGSNQALPEFKAMATAGALGPVLIFGPGDDGPSPNGTYGFLLPVNG